MTVRSPDAPQCGVCSVSLAPTWHRRDCRFRRSSPKRERPHRNRQEESRPRLLGRAALFGRTVAVGKLGRTRAEMLRFVAVRTLYVPDNAASWSGERLRLDHHLRTTSSVALNYLIVLHEFTYRPTALHFASRALGSAGAWLFFFCSFVLNFMR
jgi:hypothetical protein